MQGRVPKLDVMPVANDSIHILVDMYTLKSEIREEMTYHRANYVVIRLVTIFERLLKILAIHTTRITLNSKAEVDVTTLFAILNKRAEPIYAIRHIMAEIGSYQNINSVEAYFRNHKPIRKNDNFALEDKQKKNLDELFKLRHRLTHTVDKIEIETEHLRIFYNTISELVMSLILKYTLLSESFAKGDAYQKMNMDDAAKECFEETIRLYKSRPPNNMHSTLEYCSAYLEVGKPEQALDVFNAEIKNYGRPAHDGNDNELALLYLMGGIILTDLERWEDAAKVINRGLEIAPAKSSLLFEMTKVQLELGNPEQALEYALRTLFTPNDLSSSCYWLSKAYKALGNERIAKILSRYYEIAKRAEKNSARSQYIPEP